MQLFNRIVEDRVDVSRMRAQGGVWQTLANCYEAYRQSLESNLCCDFAHLQLKFLDFLGSPTGHDFLNGDGSLEHPGISHILVDEYQDTNPIQEEIYLKLAKHPPHNLCVVGDDDQALYRFRGGTVECMVNFDQACQRTWGQNVQISRVPLSTNYRSHPDIAQWCDDYINSFTIMSQRGARVPNKPSLIYDPDWLPNKQQQGRIRGNYPAVVYMIGQGRSQGIRDRQREAESDVARQLAELLQGLLNNRIVSDPSQCVLLLKSTREGYAGSYQEALEQRGISVYNPRSRTFLEQEEIQAVLGALVTILDPNQAVLNQVQGQGIQQTIRNWVNAYNRIAQNHMELSNYVNQAINRISQVLTGGQVITQISNQGTTTISATIQEIFYHIISYEPFVTWQEDPERTVRLGKLSKVLEAYSAVPFAGYIGSARGTLRTDSSNAGQIDRRQLNHFYYSLVGLLVSEGLSDPQSEEVICPPGRFPIMTVHQAKGLEFPFVFVGKIGVQSVSADPELQLEDAFRPFRTNPLPNNFTANERAEQDYIRLFYVAYSRAEYTLTLLVTSDELRDQGIGFGDLGRQWFDRQFQRI